ncbi:MAG: hypothetical protein KAH23_03140 [Kiritimatiellae bacterium]|nr:hypothetical protein [Kiritimatiellia bacterium]
MISRNITQFFSALSSVCIVTGLITTMASFAEDASAKPSTSEDVIKVKDFADREWRLDTTWEEGTRPYKKDLKKREAEYKKTYGENWAGELVWGRIRRWISMPGKWDYDEVVLIPDGKKISPTVSAVMKKRGSWGHARRYQQVKTVVFAPGGGKVTDLYLLGLVGVYHVDAQTKAITYIGNKTIRKDVKGLPAVEAHPKFKGGGDFFYLVGTLPKGKDGLDEDASLIAYRRGAISTIDPITGRVFFVEPMGRGGSGKLRSPMKIRYIEKLLPYKIGEREMLLPAILDHNKMYKQVNAKPVMKDGKRALPRFAVRSTPVKGGTANFANCGIWGSRIILSMDCKTVYVAGKKGIPVAVEIATGKRLGAIPVQSSGSLPWVGAKDIHGGTCSRFDDWFYNCTRQGSGPARGLLFRVNMKSGRAETLYDSFNPLASLEEKRRNKRMWDGPADAISLTFSSTRYQTQCPRTGAIFHSGWDGASLRRFHGGFITTLADNSHNPHRPDWKHKTDPAAAFGNKATPSIAPNGDMYMECIVGTGGRFGLTFPEFAKDDPERRKNIRDGIRVVRVFRTDWPKEQPVAGYWNTQISPEKCEKLMLEHAKQYIANYEEMSGIY